MITTQVAVVGAGIAGAWLAHRLAQRGVDTVLIQGPTRPVSREWAAGFLSTRLLDDPAAALRDSSRTQDPELLNIIGAYLSAEFAELQRCVELMPHQHFLIPKHETPVPRLGAGDEVVGAVLDRFAGRTVNARVTDLVVRDGICHGVRTDHGAIAANHVVIATGGLCGLFDDGVADNTGGLLGAHLRHGGTLANLEMFGRFALGDRTRRRPLYPFELRDARLWRDGEQVELAGTDLDLFRDYWTSHLGVPHTAELADTTVELGPVRGFSAGGFAGGIENLHAVGEARYGLAADVLAGLPFLVFLATSAMLADQLRCNGKPTEIPDIVVPRAPAPVRLSEIRTRLAACHDHRGTATDIDRFLNWVKETREEHDDDVLLLAEAVAASARARTESRGFFYRPDYPAEDPALTGCRTHARLNARTDRVEVQLT